MTSTVNISIVIVAANHRRYIEQCLKSLLRIKDKLQLEILLVDNASTDGCAKFVRQHYPPVHLFIQKQKRGFSTNSNIGIRQSKGRYILLLNPDTEITTNALTTLMIFMNSHPRVGICGPQLLFPDGTLQFSCRAFPTWQSVLVRRTPLRYFLQNSSINKHHLLADIDHNKIQEVDWLLGGCMMIRRKTLDNIGLLDENYYLYCEDIDICLRAKRKGWKVYYVPTARAIHHHLAVSDKKFFSMHSYHHTKSMLHYFFKYRLWMAR